MWRLFRIRKDRVFFLASLGIAVLAGVFALGDQKRDVRLRVLPFDDVRKSAEALQAGRADLAVVRPDVLLPNNAGTVAILRDEALTFAGPKAAKIDDLGDLAGKRLGVVSHHEADLPAIAKVLEHYELAAPNLTLVPLARDEVEESFAQ